MTRRGAFQFGIILVIAALAFDTRWYVIRQLGGVSGGDAYNYLFIARGIVEKHTLLLTDKRLPGYPIMLIPAIINKNIDAQLYMRLLQALSASGCIILIYALAGQLRLPWSVGLAASLLLAWQKDFFAISIRPEPYTLYACLLLLCLWLFFAARRPWQQILFGIALGYTAMTRQEGFILAAVLFLASVWPFTRYRFVSVARMFLPALLIVLPFFMHNYIVSHNPVHSAYLDEDEKLQPVDSWHAFSDANASTWSIATSMWKPSWTQLELLMPYDDGVVVLALFAVVAWWIYTQLRSTNGAWAAAVIAINQKSAAKYLPMLFAGMLWFIPFGFISRTKWRGAAVVAVLLTQGLIATWFHPFPKHYQQSYPLVILLVAATLFVLPPLKKYLSAIVWAALLAPFAAVCFILYSHLNVLIDFNNASAALDSVTYRAVKTALTLPGPYGYTADNLPARLYHKPDGVHFNSDTHQLGDIRTLVVTVPDNPPSNFDSHWPRYSRGWHEVARFASEGKNEVVYRSVVYELD